MPRAASISPAASCRKLGASYLENSRLRGSFTAKGRFTAYVDRIPTFLIEDPFLPLTRLAPLCFELPKG